MAEVRPPGVRSVNAALNAKEAVRQRARDAFAGQLRAAHQAGRDGRELDADSAMSAIGMAVNAWVTRAVADRLAEMHLEQEKVAAQWDRAATAEAGDG
jgi:hypothetical protein